jgi:maltooligosyltrehalose trehalohydrolase
VGNRALGERLGHIIDPAAYRAASALLCLLPYTPMLFMGQEWNASTPFQFFTDHNPELGRLVTEGRRKEFQNFAAFADPTQRERIPDPQSLDTFTRSKLCWDELHELQHAQMLLLYQEFLTLRTTHSALQNRSRDSWMATEFNDGIVAILYDGSGEYSLGVLVDLVGGHSAPNLDDARIAPGGGRDWQPILSSNEPRFGGDGTSFSGPTTLVLEAV